MHPGCWHNEGNIHNGRNKTVKRGIHFCNFFLNKYCQVFHYRFRGLNIAKVKRGLKSFVISNTIKLHWPLSNCPLPDPVMGRRTYLLDQKHYIIIPKVIGSSIGAFSENWYWKLI